MPDNSRIRDLLTPHLDRTVEHTDACPDCDANTTVVQARPGVYVVDIAHDTACPTHISMKGPPS